MVWYFTETYVLNGINKVLILRKYRILTLSFFVILFNYFEGMIAGILS